MVKIKINDIEVEAEESQTILEAAKKVNIKIPTLCHYDLPDIDFVNKEANCRVCLVQWGKGLVPACNTLVKEGMEIRTDTQKVINSRKINIELLLSNHPKTCLVCQRNGNCELQTLAAENNIREVRFPGKMISRPIDDSSYSIIRDPNKCILCKRCETMCNDFQTVGTLTEVGRGFETVVGTNFMQPMYKTNCTFCGQCLSVCPTGALSEVSEVREVYKALSDDSKIVIVQTAPAVRVALGESFGMEPGTVVTGQMVTALKSLGFDYVFDTDFAADVTAIEEAHEIVDRIENNGRLPIITSCCPSWVNFIETNFPELLDIPSTCKSPHEMFGSIAKSYFAEKINVDPKDIVVVSVMPCVAKKYESKRPELVNSKGYSDVDHVITTRELAEMIRDMSLSLADLDPSDFDNLMGESTGAGVIFGSTGGVLESALRTAYNIMTDEDLEDVEFSEMKELKGTKISKIKLAGKELTAVATSGLGNARRVLEKVESGEANFDIIEIMACPGGCVNGGGQPRHKDDVSVIQKRINGILNEDRGKSLRRSYENPEVQKLYDDYLDHPASEKAHQLLHTTLDDEKTVELF